MGKLSLSFLREAKDLLGFLESSVSEIKTLKSRIDPQKPSASALLLIDEISNVSSKAADIAQAVGDLFPSTAWKQAAFQVSSQMQHVFAELNSDKTFYTTLVNLKESKLYHKLTPSQQLVTLALIKEFEKEGTHCNSSSSYRMFELQEEFLRNSDSVQATLEFAFEEIEQVPTQLRPDRLGKVYGELNQKTYSKAELKALLSNSPSSSVRKQAFDSINNLAPQNSDVLNQLLEERNKLAKQRGFRCYSSYLINYQMFPIDTNALQDLLVKCHSFLYPKLQNEYSILQDRKALKEQVSRESPVALEPWDFSYYMNSYLHYQKLTNCPYFSKHYEESNFFTIKNVLNGVKQLCGVLGTDFDFSIADKTESWSNDIIKAEFKKQGRLVGVLYFDLFTRPGKLSTGPYKLNVVCPKLSQSNYQVPISVLACNFSKPDHLESSLRVTLEDLDDNGLSFEQLKEFYHELGHSLHSILSQSEFQSFSGTRVPLDFAEIHSHIFEHFISDYQFVSSWALHKQTQERIPESLFKHLSNRDTFKALSHHMQLSMSLFDLILHSGKSPEEASLELQKHIETKELQGNWYLSLGHLAEYGGCYYSYVVDQAISELVWELVFNKELNSKGGEMLSEFLSHGGHIPGEKQLAKLVGPFLIDNYQETTIDPFALVEGWYRTHFKNQELVSIKEIRAKY